MFRHYNFSPKLDHPDLANGPTLDFVSKALAGKLIHWINFIFLLAQLSYRPE
jgi:hypothetical protein